ncbi:helix-turn-helix transcriptional regulator [Tabrizicola piscis]|uniref:helix-turn-helix transcriptional regulator n=1 Tax=Tabrizicola piscis TaxID=2494374 RepID=UPI0013DDB8AD|nr:LuxR family transcriptional regulator [Tabrizicola piscis]
MHPASLQQTLIGTLDRIRHCATDEERWLCGASLLQDCGSDWVTAGTAPRGRPADVAVRSTTPDSLMRDYVREQIHLDDPWMQLCAQGCDLDHLDVGAHAGLRHPTTKARVSRLFADHGVRRAVLVFSYAGTRPGGLVLYDRNARQADWLHAPDGLEKARLIVAILSAFYRPEQDRSGSDQLYAMGSALSAREREVLQWLFHGHRTARIAEQMGIECVTVSKHLMSIRRKLGAKTREQALAIAVRDGLIAV